MSTQTRSTTPRATPDPATTRARPAPAAEEHAALASGTGAILTAPLLVAGGNQTGPVLRQLGPIQQQQAVLAVQRTAGNAVAQRLLAPRSVGKPIPARLVQRYEAGEHAQFGGEMGKQTNVTVNGVTMTYGEMIAMA